MGASSSASLVQDNGLPISDDRHLAILNEEMSHRNIRRADIPSRFSSRTVRGHGRAQCGRCSRKWTSHQASAKINLKYLTVGLWKQKCQNCDNIVYIIFKENEFRRMINNMLDRVERQMGGEYLSNHDDANSGGFGPPHRKELCEGCDWGRGDCRSTSGGGNYEKQDRAMAYARGGTTGSGWSSSGGNGSGGGSGSGSGGDSSSGLGAFGAFALGAVGLLAAGALAVSAYSESCEEEEQKKRGRKK